MSAQSTPVTDAQLPEKPGIYGFYKPVGMSSYDVIRILKKSFPGEKTGHGGTLDPLAEGVVVVAIGSAYTKQLQTVLKGTPKTYEALIELGAISATDDSEGPITRVVPMPSMPDKHAVESVLESFVGQCSQTPPKFAAVKIAGQRAYKRARRGEEFVVEPKTVTIHSIVLGDYTPPLISATISCGSGTYIRALARDIGEALGTGAYLKALKRTAVGEFTAENTIRLTPSSAHHTFVPDKRARHAL